MKKYRTIKSVPEETKTKVHGNIKCDCHHTQKAHHNGEGWCNKCACTWFWPNIEYVKHKKKVIKEATKEEKVRYVIKQIMANIGITVDSITINKNGRLSVFGHHEWK